MPLLNYTTEVPASRTVSQVNELLVKAGAREILATYSDDGRPVGVAFALPTSFGVRRFVLPVNVLAVEQVMRRHGSGVPPRYQNHAQAERVAWRILKDWLEAQLAIIATEQVAADQVLLPYLVVDDGGRTLYAAYREQQLALEAGQ